MVQNFTKTEIETLIRSDEPIEFLKLAIERQYRKKGRVNLADFSRRSGFTSRSYLSELLSGKKGLSRDAVLRIRGALRIPKPLPEIFELLAYRSMPALRPNTLDITTIENKLSMARTLARNLEKSRLPEKSNSKFVRDFRLHQIYAGLGTLESGASVAEIKSKTNLPEKTIEACLQLLVTDHVVNERNGRFYAVASQMDHFRLKDRDGLGHLISDICSDIRTRRQGIIDNPLNDIFLSAFSTQSSRLPELRKKLRDAVFAVLDEFQDDDGDCVRQVFLSLYL